MPNTGNGHEFLVKILDGVRKAEQAATHAADRVLKLDGDFRKHTEDERVWRTAHQSSHDLLSQRLDKIEGNLDDVEDTTDQIERDRRDSDRAKRRIAEQRIEWWKRLAVRTLVGMAVALFGAGASWIAHDLMNRPAAAQGR